MQRHPWDLRKLLADRRAVTALEYGIMAALIVSAVGLAMANLGQALVDMWREVASAFPPNGPTTPGQVRSP